MIISPRVDYEIAHRELGKRPLRLGIMGGTFDPIHYGHLICAEQAREQFGLDYVIFMPTGNPAFKADKQVTAADRRYEMAVVATRKNEYFDVSRVEIDRQGTTYTYDTLRELTEKTPEGTELFFITGADAILSVLKWRNSEEVLKLAQFVAATRPGYDYNDLQDEIELFPKMAGRVSFFEVPGLAISSTDLRKRVREGKSIAYMTPISVFRYIDTHNLYAASDL